MLPSMRALKKRKDRGGPVEGKRRAKRENDGIRVERGRGRRQDESNGGTKKGGHAETDGRQAEEWMKRSRQETGERTERQRQRELELQDERMKREEIAGGSDWRRR